MVNTSRCVQLATTAYPRLVTLEGMASYFRLVQALKAVLSIFVTVLGIVTLLRRLQLAKAERPI